MWSVRGQFILQSLIFSLICESTIFQLYIIYFNESAYITRWFVFRHQRLVRDLILNLWINRKTFASKYILSALSKVGILLRVYAIAVTGAVGGQFRCSKIDFHPASRGNWKWIRHWFLELCSQDVISACVLYGLSIFPLQFWRDHYNRIHNKRNHFVFST